MKNSRTAPASSQEVTAAFKSRTIRSARTTIVGEFADRAAGDAAALFENAEVAGHAPRKRQLLLDQQHRQAGLFVQPQEMSPISCTMFG